MDDHASIRAWMKDIDLSQWRSAAKLWAYQRSAAEALLDHARRTVPFYSERLAPFFGNGRLDWSRWSEIPVLERQEALEKFDSLCSTAVPLEHGRIADGLTSGSSGSPVRFRRTQYSNLRSIGLIHRGLGWHRFDPTSKMAYIISGGGSPYPDGSRYESWSEVMAILGVRGELVRLNINTPVDRQAEWLRRERPSYLHTYPSNAHALGLQLVNEPIEGLQKIYLVGETLKAETRTLWEERLGVGVVDRYGAIEIGQIAMQCPTGHHYHVQCEGVLLEVVDREGRQVAPRERGQVVVTSLLNYAFPLIRYRILDHVELGFGCSCGRGLPVLTRVLGRERHMFRFPDGREVWAAFGPKISETLAPRRWQVAQVAPLAIEIRFVPGPTSIAPDYDTLARYIRATMAVDVSVRYKVCESLPDLSSGKFHDYVCEL